MAAKGEVLLVTRISPGRVSISNIDVAINQALKIVRPKLEHLEAEFIYYLFCAYNRDIDNTFSCEFATIFNLPAKSIKEESCSLMSAIIFGDST